MLHNWKDLIRQVCVNATGKTLDGEPGDWGSALYQLIHEAYKRPGDDEDQCVMAVLIALHQALDGQTSLLDLAHLCVQFDRQHNPFFDGVKPDREANP